LCLVLVLAITTVASGESESRGVLVDTSNEIGEGLFVVNELPKNLFGLFQSTSVVKYFPRETDFWFNLFEQEIAGRDDMSFFPIFVQHDLLNEDDAVREKNFIEQELVFRTLERALPLAPLDCGMATIRLLTALRLQISWEFEDTFTVGGGQVSEFFLSALPCQSLCEDFFAQCTGLVPDALLAAFPPCNTPLNATVLPGVVDFAPGQSLYPENATEVIITESNSAQQVISRTSYYIPCTDYRNAGDFDYVPPCQSPLSLNPEAFVPGSPFPPCSDDCLGYILYTEDQWDANKVILGVVGWASFLTTSYLIVTLLMNPKNRRYPGVITVGIACGTTLATITFAIGACTGIEAILCENKFTPATFDHGACVWQGSFMIYGSLMGFLFWTAISLNTFLTLSMRWKLDSFKWGIFSFALGLGFPMFALIVVLAMEEIAYSAPIPWCWYGRYELEWGLFYSILIFVTLLNVISICFVMWELRNIQDSSKGKRAKYMKVVRVAVFLIVFLELSVFLIAMQAKSTHKEDEYTEVSTRYGTCLFTNEVDPCPRPEDGTGTLPVAQWYALSAHVTGQGFAVFAVFGTTGQIFFFWCRAIRNLASGRSIFDDLMDSTTGATSSSSASWAAANEYGEEDSFDPDHN